MENIKYVIKASYSENYKRTKRRVIRKIKHVVDDSNNQTNIRDIRKIIDKHEESTCELIEKNFKDYTSNNIGFRERINDVELNIVYFFETKIYEVCMIKIIFSNIIMVPFKGNPDKAG